jgi:mRNA interferase MazF
MKKIKRIIIFTIAMAFLFSNVVYAEEYWGGWFYANYTNQSSQSSRTGSQSKNKSSSSNKGKQDTSYRNIPRPVLVIQNDIGNKYSPTTIVCILTSQKNKSDIPTHVFLGQKFGLPKESFALLEQIRTIDKVRLKRKVGEIKDNRIMDQIDRAIHISFGLKIHEAG